MKRWWGWVFAGLRVAGLLLSLGLEITGVNHNPYAGSDQSVGLSRKSISIALFPTLLATSTQWIQSRAGPLESLAIPWALSAAGDVGPPWLDYRGPPGVCGGRRWVSCQAVGHAGSSEQGQNTLPPLKFLPSTDPTKKWSFVTALS